MREELADFMFTYNNRNSNNRAKERLADAHLNRRKAATAVKQERNRAEYAEKRKSDGHEYKGRGSRTANRGPQKVGGSLLISLLHHVMILETKVEGSRQFEFRIGIG